MICEKCGEEVNGLMAWVNHPCNGTIVEYEKLDDNEMRNAMMEIGMPTMAFETFGMAVPTEMERKIFEVKSDPKPYYLPPMSVTMYEALKKYLEEHGNNDEEE